jgi:hypothetical protein
MKLYGYNLAEKRKFMVDVEDLCDFINMGYEISPLDDYYVYTNEEDRDLHFNDNVKIDKDLEVE